MPVGPESLFHPFQVETDKSAESFHGNLPFAISSANRFHTHFEFGGQFVGGDPQLSHGISSLTLMSRRTALTILMGTVMVKDPSRGHEWTGGDTGGHH
jgi:hypothetical protein